MTTQERIKLLSETIGSDVKNLLNRSHWQLFSKLNAISSAIANTETQVLSLSIPANTLVVGDTFRITAMALHTNTLAASTSAYKIRIGSTTLTGAVASANSFDNGIIAKTNIIVKIEALVMVQSIGASGTILGQIHVDKGYTSPTIPTGLTTAVALNTTAANLIELTFQSGAATTTNTFYAGIIELLR